MIHTLENYTVINIYVQNEGTAHEYQRSLVSIYLSPRCYNGIA